MSRDTDIGICPICHQEKVLIASRWAMVYTCWQCRGRETVAEYLRIRGEALKRAFGPKGE